MLKAFTSKRLGYLPHEFAHPRVKVRTNCGKIKSSEREYVTTPGLGTDTRIGAHENSVVNLLRALNERVYNVEEKVGGVKTGRLVPCPQPRPNSFGGEVAEAATRIAEYCGVSKRLTGQQFVDQCPSEKRKLYAAAMEEYRRVGWTSNSAMLKSFVKYEKINLTAKPDPAPRIIQPRRPVYNFALGRYTRAVEKKLYRAVATLWGNGDDEEVVMKGLTIDGVAKQLRKKWDKFRRPVAVGLDASRFDQHVSKQALWWEHSIYNRVFNGDLELRELLRLQCRSKGVCFSEGRRITYTVDGVRCSGDMNTGLGNSLIMSCLVWAYCKELGIRCELGNNGDDCVVFMEASDLSYFKLSLDDWFLERGFEMEVEKPCYEFEDIEFCQMHPVRTGNGWIMVRNIDVALSKDVVGLGCTTEADYHAWLSAVGTCGLALYADVPIYCEFYKLLQRMSGGRKARATTLESSIGMLRMRRNLKHAELDRVSFFKAFGIWPCQQVAWESKYRSCQVLPLGRECKLGQPIRPGGK